MPDAIQQLAHPGTGDLDRDRVGQIPSRSSSPPAASRKVSLVVMEATGDHWKPFDYLLAEAGLEVMLVNPRQARQIPGPQDRWCNWVTGFLLILG